MIPFEKLSNFYSQAGVYSHFGWNTAVYHLPGSAATTRCINNSLLERLGASGGFLMALRGNLQLVMRSPLWPSFQPRIGAGVAAPAIHGSRVEPGMTALVALLSL